VARWTLRVAAIGLWGVALRLGWVAVVEPSTFRVLLSLLFAIWAFAVWRRRELAIRILIVALVVAGLFIPVGVINPFHAIDAPPTTVAEPGFVARTILGALGASAIAFAIAVLLLRASSDIRGQTVSPGTFSQGWRSWRATAILLGLAWGILVVLSTTSFLRAVEMTQ
jgi:hypothetical protein